MRILLLILLLVQRSPAPAQAVAQKYARAEAMLGRNAKKLVYGGEVAPTWIDSGRFWYRNRIRGGSEFVVVDPTRGTRERAFDHARLAASLSVAADTSYVPLALPFDRIRFSDGARQVRFVIGKKEQEWTCDLSSYTCSSIGVSSELHADEIPSPNGKLVAFVRNENLWVRERASGSERQLSRDGVEHYGYAVVPEDRDE